MAMTFAGRLARLGVQYELPSDSPGATFALDTAALAIAAARRWPAASTPGAHGSR
jgi:hypothetical protein